MQALRKQEDGTAKRAAALAVLKTAETAIGNEAIRDIVVPTVERILRGDVEIVDLFAGADIGLVKAIRSKGLGYRLRRLGLGDDLIQVAMRFARDFEAARIGKLTANYEGGGRGTKVAAEPERMAEAMDILTGAMRGPVGMPMSHDERVVMTGYLVADMPMADLGAFAAAGLTPDKNIHKFTGKLYLAKALTKLAMFYEDLDWRQGANGY